MFLGRSVLPFNRKQVESIAYQLSGFPWINDLVNVSETCGNVRIGKLLPVLLHKLRKLFLLVLFGFDFRMLRMEI